MEKGVLKGIVIGVIIGLLIGYVVASFFPVFKFQKEESLLEKIKKRGVLIVGTSADWPPFEYIDKNGQYAGIDIEIVKKIAEALGVKLQIKDIKFDALIAALKGGEIDLVIADMTPTAEREKEVDFSKPYFSDVFVFVSLKEAPISSIEDLYGKSVGVQQGTTQEDWAMENLKGKCEIKSYTKVYPDMVLVLERGDVSAILVSKTVAEVIIAKNPKLKIAFIVKGTEEYAAIA
ncbi:MAG: amino acid ABC transporter substrate-binding protein, partial [Thermoprotei archaeon]